MSAKNIEMPRTGMTMSLIITALLLLPYILSTSAAVLVGYDTRDVDAPFGVSALGWNVPLRSGLRSLPNPTAGYSLKHLTLGRGTYSFVCPNASDAPAFQQQTTELFDVAPIAPNLPDLNALHNLIPKLCNYDYSLLHNSSVVCKGRIETLGDDIKIDLFGFGEPVFNVAVTSSIPPPLDPLINARWAQSVSEDKTWEIYRVYTAGGQVPKTCESSQQGKLDITYAAEYWFYHR